MGKKHLLLNQPIRLVVHRLVAIRLWLLLHGNLRQVYILHDRPHNSQTTGFCRERVDLIGPLTNVAKKAFNGIGVANVAVHDRWKSIKGQQMLFIFTETADGFRITLLIFGFKCRQIEECIFFLLLRRSIPVSSALTSLRSR